MLRWRSGKISDVDEQREDDDRPAVVAEEAVDPLERLEERHDEPGEHAEVDRAHELDVDGVQHVEVLGPHEERHARGARHDARCTG